MGEERSLADTPTWSVATIITVLVAICFLVQRSIYRFGKVWGCTCIWAFDHCFRLGCLDCDLLVTNFQWLRMTRRKALLASLEKIKEGVYFVSSVGSSFQRRSQLLSIRSKFREIDWFLFGFEELMLLGLISLMLGQWAHWISDICVDSSLFSSRFYPCTEDEVDAPTNRNRYVVHNLSQIATHQKHCAEVIFHPYFAIFMFMISYLMLNLKHIIVKFGHYFIFFAHHHFKRLTSVVHACTG